ncbi:MAG: hypothetical protein ROZ64_07080 [Burkholderiaceae bacterium]|nr:hypothetical protein [Burkholderiaceae bacterium]
MKIHDLRAALALAGALALAAGFAPSASATDIGVSVQVGQPGFYGRIDIGNAPRPMLLYPEPILVQPAPVAVARPPIYLRVPPGHAKNWSKHCYRYSACGQPVYFVQDQWYEDVYVPQYRSVHRGERQYVRDHVGSREYVGGRERFVESGPRGDGRGYGHPGKGHGNGNGKGKGRD